ncbi:uncharacterized protein LOC120130237 [Hibiscus syriacus]|uniref:uncharacterized protein LOC120130237 n=1 Tax=Hibiscus syriacus TaxID=106335 RepID=UPI0019226AE1|nr:uncharacterized protein LOC120130237 [Hibiscus syriacus]
MVIESVFWVVSDYRTENQGGFEESAELTDLRTGQWSQIVEVWKASQCPRSCVEIRKKKTLFSWGNRDSKEWTFVSGNLSGWPTRVLFVSRSAYQGGQQGFFVVDKHGEKNSRASMLPIQFSDVNVQG